ncbi:MAG: putative Membrane Associated Protein [Paenibacillus sp.]|nr:putative Membrane Associated Protein [Paenibacillus sp.]
MQQLKAEWVLDVQNALGEGPCWDERTGVLWWVNITDGKVHRYNPVTEEQNTYAFEQFVTVVVPGKDGKVIISFPHAIASFDPETGVVETLIDGIESDLPDNRFNDGKCDSAGRLWIGSMSMSGKPAQGKLYCIQPDLTVREALSGIGCSNGIAWSVDGGTMYYIDSPTRQVVAFDFDAESGELSGRRVVVQFGDNESGVPDGMTIDDEGMLWVAQWGGAELSRWNPTTGTKLGVVAVPALQVTSAMFAGPERDELYITTARTGLNDEQLAQYPLSGGLFRIRPGVSGAAVHSFKG